MKVLLVTDQLLKIEGTEVLGPANFTSIVKRLSVLGELHLCLLEYKNNTNGIQIFNDSLSDIVNPQHIHFIEKSYIWPSRNTLNTLKEAISKVDLVIGYVPALNAEVSERLAHKAGKKYFALMVACPWDGLWNQDWKRKIAAPYRFLMNRQVLKNADYALYVTKEFLQNRYPTKGVSLGLSDVVLEKSDNEILNNRLLKIKNKTDNEDVNLATTAMLNVRYKGQRFVFHAIKKLKELGYPNYHYYLIGGGDNTVLKKLAHSLGIENQIHFVGKTTHQEVFKILDKTDIYVHPSLQEGLPRSVVEAMSRALPCIGAQTGAIPELIDEKFVVKRKSIKGIVDKLLLFKDKRLLESQARRNFEEAKKYECNILDKERSIFYESIKKDIENGNS